MTTINNTNTPWFRDRLAERRLSQRGLAKLMGLDPGALSLTLRGLREMKMAECVEMARLLGVTADEVMKNAGIRVDHKHDKIRISGWIDGIGEYHPSPDEPLGEVPHPGIGYPVHLKATLCRTAGSHIDHMDGWLLFHEDVSDGVPADAIGRLSLCKLRGAGACVAKPTRSFTRGRWNLSGPAVSTKDVELDWAMPVLTIAT